MVIIYIQFSFFLVLFLQFLFFSRGWGGGMIVFHLFFSAHNIGILLDFILLDFMMMMNDNSDRDTEQHVKMNIYEMKQKVIDDDVVEDKRLKAKYDGDHMEVIASENGNMYFMDIDDRSMLNQILNQPMSSMSLMDRLKMEMEKEKDMVEDMEKEKDMVEDMEKEKDMVEDMEKEKDMVEDMEEVDGMEEEEKKKKDKKKKRKSKNKTAKKKGGKKAKKSNGKKKSKKNMKLAFYGRGKTIKHKKKTEKKKTAKQ